VIRKGSDSSRVIPTPKALESPARSLTPYPSSQRRIWRPTSTACSVGHFTRKGGNVTDPGFPIHRQPTDEDLEREAMRIRQDVVDAVDAFKRYTSEESRDLLASARDDDELGSES